MEKGPNVGTRRGRTVGLQHHGAWIKRGDAQYDDVGGNRSSETLVWHETGLRRNLPGRYDPFTRQFRVLSLRS